MSALQPPASLGGVFNPNDFVGIDTTDLTQFLSSNNIWSGSNTFGSSVYIEDVDGPQFVNRGFNRPVFERIDDDKEYTEADTTPENICIGTKAGGSIVLTLPQFDMSMKGFRVGVLRNTNTSSGCTLQMREAVSGEITASAFYRGGAETPTPTTFFAGGTVGQVWSLYYDGAYWSYVGFATTTYIL